MPILSFVDGTEIEVPKNKNLMKAVQNAGRPVANSCEFDGVCGHCVLQILEGQENLSQPGEKEITLAKKEGLKPDQRVSCLCRILGDLRVDAAYW